MDLPIAFFVIAAIMVFLTGVSKVGLAAGFGSLGVPMLSLFVPPAVAAGILLPILIVIDTTNLWTYRNHFQKQYFLLMIPGAILGIALGSLAFGVVDPNFVRLMVGLIALWFAAIYYGKKYLPDWGGKLDMKWGFAFAAMSGFTSHLAHAGGPPVRAFLLNQNLHKSEFVGTFGFFFAVVNWMKLPPYIAFGQINWDTLPISAMLLPMVPFGVFVGIFLHKKLKQEQFMRVAYVLLTITGLKLVYDALAQII